MTLSTDIRIVSPIDGLTVFHKVREILGATETHPFQQKFDSHRNAIEISNNVGIGLDAWLHAWFREDNDRLIDVFDEDSEWNPPTEAQNPYVIVNLDTSYGAIPSASEIHSEIICKLGEWLNSQGVDWWAENEFDGTWHHQTDPFAVSADNDYPSSDTTETPQEPPEETIESQQLLIETLSAQVDRLSEENRQLRDRLGLLEEDV